MVRNFIKNIDNRSDYKNSILLIVRICFLSLSLLCTTLYTEFFIKNDRIFDNDIYLIIAVVFAINVIWGFWTSSTVTSEKFTYLQIFTDSIIVSTVILLTGVTSSPFLFLYLPVVMSAACTLNKTKSLIFSIFCFVQYLIVLYVTKYEFFSFLSNAQDLALPQYGLTFHLLSLFLAMFLITLGTCFLISKIKERNNLNSLIHDNILQISKNQAALINQMPEAIISTDKSFKITNFNDAAINLFNLTSKNFHSDIFKVLSDLRNDLEKIVNGDKDENLIFTLKNTEEGEKKLSCSFLKNKSKNGEADNVFVFKDITTLEQAKEKLEIQEQMAQLVVDRKSNLGSSRLNGSKRKIIGKSDIMEKVFQLVEKVAPSDANILITGESGTGKELIARAIHEESKRTSKPFFALNCGAIPEGLIESELFGHKKGAFTGAESNKLGILRAAKDGTVFLDEIGELPQQLQTKLLRALQEKKLKPVGEEHEVPFFARIVSATNRDLKKEIESGQFREDLYYRINVIKIALPSLRERKDDIPLLLDFMIQKHSNSDLEPKISPTALQYLINYNYPGNVRELENIVERALILGEEAILPEHLPDIVTMQNIESLCLIEEKNETQIIETDQLNFPINLEALLSEVEKNYLVSALNEANGVKTKAAELLGINFRSFRYRLNKFDIE